MKTIILISLALFLAACASNADPDENEDRKGSMQVSLGTGADYVTCESRNSICFANVQRACGALGVVTEDLHESNRVVTAGSRGSTDDPFARAERGYGSKQPIKVRCGEPKSSE